MNERQDYDNMVYQFVFNQVENTQKKLDESVKGSDESLILTGMLLAFKFSLSALSAGDKAKMGVI